MIILKCVSIHRHSPNCAHISSPSSLSFIIMKQKVIGESIEWREMQTTVENKLLMKLPEWFVLRAASHINPLSFNSIQTERTLLIEPMIENLINHFCYHKPKDPNTISEIPNRWQSQQQKERRLKKGVSCVLLGELAKLGFNAAMPHAHSGQCWTNLSGCP